jgi:MurNAc alpha-1-phosphate uridylyltransferase
MIRVSRAMVMAAGYGKRMRPITDTRPKPLVEICGRALIDHVLDRLEAAGIEEVVVNAHYLGDQIERHLAQRRVPRCQISREDVLLETGGGLVNALPMLGDEPFYVLNADIFWFDGAIPALQRLARAWNGDTMDSLLLLQRTVSALSYDGVGDYHADPAGVLTRRQGTEVAPFLFAGVELLHPRALAGRKIEPFSRNLVWDELQEQRRLFGLVHDGLWFHIGSPNDLQATETFLDDNRLSPTLEWAGARKSPV